MIEHRTDQLVLGAEVPNTSPWLTFDLAAMSRIDVAAGPRSANRSVAASKIAAATSSRPVGVFLRLVAERVAM